MNRRGVAEMLREEREHGFHHCRVAARGGVVVQIDGVHGAVLCVFCRDWGLGDQTSAGMCDDGST